MLGDRGRTPTHIEIAVGTRVVESSYKGTWDIMECWKHSLPTPQQCFAAVRSINLENSTGGFVGALWGLKLWGTNGTGHGATRSLSAMRRTGAQPGLGSQGIQPPEVATR